MHENGVQSIIFGKHCIKQLQVFAAGPLRDFNVLLCTANLQVGDKTFDNRTSVVVTLPEIRPGKPTGLNCSSAS